MAVLAITAASALIIRKAAAPKPPEFTTGHSGTRMVMGTFANITAVAEDEKTIAESIEAAYKQLVAVDEMMSDYKEDSELSVVNREAYERPVQVSEPLFDVLQTSVAYSKLSGGAFDVTIGPVVQLWRSIDKKGTRPTDEEMAAARARVGYEKLILDDEKRTVRFAEPGMLLDLGAIAKGYGIDRAIEAMQAAGAAGGLVDVGGDIRCFGISPKMTRVWRIGLDNPDGSGDIPMVLNLSDTAIATSGDYRRFVMLDDQRYSHIIDPAAGSSANGLTSVTIIASRAVEADALATAVSVLGQKKGLELVESVGNTEAVIIPGGSGLEFIKTSGADAFID